MGYLVNLICFPPSEIEIITDFLLRQVFDSIMPLLSIYNQLFLQIFYKSSKIRLKLTFYDDNHPCALTV